MTIPTPQEYGRFLGFSLGIDGPASATFPRTMEELMSDTISGVSQYLEYEAPEDEVLSYGGEFTSLFFPSFIRTCIGLTESGRQSMLCLALYQTLCLTSNSTTRSIREHPGDALKLYVALANGLAFSSDGAESVLNIAEDGALKVCSFVATFAYFVTDLATQLPSSFTLLPPLSDATRAGLHYLLVLIRDDPRFIPFSHDMSILVLDEALGGRSLELFREVLVEIEKKHVWFDCQLAQSSKDVVCVKPEGGQQMMACSRCLTVRYCSKEHQKADWKRHKLACFKPSW